TATGPELRLNHLPPMILAKPGGSTTVSGNGYLNSLAQNRESTERAVIIRALEKASFSRTRAAAALGVSRVTLYKKMKKYGLLTKATPLLSLPGDVAHVAGGGMN